MKRRRSSVLPGSGGGALGGCCASELVVIEPLSATQRDCLSLVAVFAFFRFSAAAATAEEPYMYMDSSIDGCAIIDVSRGTQSLQEAQALARKKTAGGGCANVLLGQRSFGITSGLVRPTVAPLVLTGDDSRTSYIGGELTASIDVAPGNWSVRTDGSGVANLELPPAAGGLGHPTTVDHLQLAVEIDGEWRPMSLARWPNVPFDYEEVPPVNWTTVGSVNSSCGAVCNSFVWSNDTERPARWVKAASEGRLFVQGFFKYLWRDSRAQIDRVDPLARTLSTDANTISASGVYANSPYFAYGHLHEELDVPGEFAIENRTRVLSAILPHGCLNDNDAVVCRTRLIPASSAALTLVSATGASNITLRGLNISGSAGVGVAILNSTNVRMEKLRLNNLQTGVSINTAAPRANVSLTHSEVGFTLFGSAFSFQVTTLMVA
jgi:hypothetical protein